MTDYEGDERRETSYVTRHQAMTIAQEAGTHAATEVLEGFGIYASTPEAKFRKAMYSLAKSLQAQGISIPDDFQDYVNHCDAVKRDNPK